MNVFQLLQTTDVLLSTTIFVVNETATPKGAKVSGQWVCFFRSEDSHESELIGHLPPLEPLTVQLQDVLYTSDMGKVFFVEPRPRRHTAAVALPTYEPTFEEVEALEMVLGDVLTPLLAEGIPLAHAYHSIHESHAARVPTEPTPLGPGDVTTRVSHPGHPTPSRRLREGKTPHGVPELFHQILSAIRAVLLTLLDTSARLCRSPDGEPDPDFLGRGPATAVYTAMDKMCGWSIPDFVPNVKYWKDYPLASFLENPLPAVPASWTHPTGSKQTVADFALPPQGHKSDDPLFSGRLAEYWRRICHPASADAESSDLFRAAFSLAQSKRGFAPVPNYFVSEAYRKHAKKLGQKPAPLTESTRLDLGRFLKVFFRNFHPRDLLARLEFKEGSTSSSNTAYRETGGAREDLRQLLSNHFGTGLNSLVRMVETDTGLVEERGLTPPSLDEWERLARAPLDFRYQESGLMPDHYLELSHGEKYPFSKVVALREPLKVRIITKMQTLSTFLCGPLQGALWRYLGQFPQFALTKETFQEAHLAQLIQQDRDLFPPPGPARSFVSGDYSAATDGLNIEATRQVMDSILARLTPRDREIFAPHVHTVLMEQVLVYPNDQPDILPVLQQNGQLMGSILSFPILCILNLFTYVQSLPEPLRLAVLGGRLSLRKLAVLINGDDILFKAAPSQYQAWLESSSSVGFTLSLGKNFVHPRFLTVNSLPIEVRVRAPAIRPPTTRLSASWRGDPSRMGYLATGDRPRYTSTLSWADVDELESSNPWVFEPTSTITVHSFIRIGLVLGLGRTLNRMGVEMSAPLGALHQVAVCGAMNPARAHGLFLHYNHDELVNQTRFGRYTLNIFAHPLLGGLGFEIPQGVTPRYSEPQRHLAWQLLSAASKSYRGPQGDHPLRAFTALVDVARSSVPSLGTLGADRPVVTRLDAGFGPHVDDAPLFDPDILIRATPLAALVLPSDDSWLVPRARLTNRELQALLKTANHGRSEMLLPHEMPFFPFVVVLVESPSETPIQELPTSLALPPTSEPEDWELLTTFPAPPGPVPGAPLVPPSQAHAWKMEEEAGARDLALRFPPRPLPGPPPPRLGRRRYKNDQLVWRGQGLHQ